MIFPAATVEARPHMTLKRGEKMMPPGLPKTLIR
jgi:hypothetical protein